MSNEVGVIVVFLMIAGVAALWAFAQDAENKRTKAAKESLRKESVQRKYAGSPYLEDLSKGLIRQGMTDDMVIDAWGRPDAVDRKVYKTKVKEVWKYGPGPRRTFANRVTLENGVVVGWENR